jgi:hypothetical protein
MMGAKVLPWTLTAIGAALALQWLGVGLPAIVRRVTGPATTIAFFVLAWPHIRKVLG